MLERISKQLAVTAIVAAITGCNAPDRSPESGTDTTQSTDSQSIVMVDLQSSLHRPVVLSEDKLRRTHDEVDELAAASRLATLTSESANEIRIWRTVATFGPAPGYATVGYVITQSGISRCEIGYPPDGQPPFTGKCKIVRRAPHDFDAARFLEPLLPYANTGMGCGVFDGEWYTLDIVHGGKRFVIGASNPDQCNDKGSAAVSSLLEAVP